MRFRTVLPLLCLALPLVALDASSNNTIGVQARLSLPGGNIPDVVGRNPGIGGSLQAELNFDSSVCLRLTIGADDWRQKGASENRSVQAYHLGVEGVYFLRDEGADFLKGPYILGGLAAYTWAIGADARSSGTALRATKACFDAGLGYRFNEHVDVELKVLVGAVEPGFTANATTIGVTYRF